LLPSQTLIGQTLVKFPSRNLAYSALAGFCLVVIVTAAAFFVPPSYALTAFGDLLQILLVCAATLLFAKNAYATRGSTRVFWSLLALSFAIWLASLWFWVYFEVCLKRPVPDLPISDLLLFLKLAPLFMALALEPRKADSPLSRILGFLDLSLLMVYWLYFYAFWVSVYRLIPHETARYNFHYDALNALGNQFLLIAAALMAIRSRQPWRMLYRCFFFSSAVYCVASVLSNVAIDAGTYYTGSLYDVPLVASLAGFVWIGLAGGRMQLVDPPPAEIPLESSFEVKNFPYWTSLFGMLVTLSTPVIGLYLLLSADMPGEIRRFRIQATLVSMFVLTLLLIIKQDILSSHLARSLREVSQSYSSLTRFKDQLLQNEKLASLGQLVAGVANEIKKAMNEILNCVARLTAHSCGNAAALAMTSKIGQYASRTNSLVESMLSFARETPPQKASLNVNSLLETAITLSRAAKNRSIRATLLFEPALPGVSADAGQLLQVFMNVISNATDAMEGSNDGELRVSTKLSGEHVIIEFADSGTGLQEPDRVFEPFYTTKSVGKGTGLGLSTCYGIIHRHGGEITCRNNPEVGAIFTIVLPCAPLAPEGVTLPGDLVLREK
jgi:signal transduction histidine kinase